MSGEWSHRAQILYSLVMRSQGIVHYYQQPQWSAKT